MLVSLMTVVLGAGPSADGGLTLPEVMVLGALQQRATKTPPETLLVDSRRLSRCAQFLEADTRVAVQWQALEDGGVENLHFRGPASPLGDCVVTWFATFRPVPGSIGPREQSWLLATDGGVELRDSRGGLEESAVLAVITDRRREIRFCYERALADQPELVGKLTTAWTIDAEGTVIEARVTQDTMQAPQVAECVLERLKRWRFPRPTNGGRVNVTFPWIFKSAGK